MLDTRIPETSDNWTFVGVVSKWPCKKKNFFFGFWTALENRTENFQFEYKTVQDPDFQSALYLSFETASFDDQMALGILKTGLGG